MFTKVIKNISEVEEYFLNANSDCLPDYAERDLQFNICGDFAIVDAHGTFVGGAAFEYELNGDSLSLSIQYVHIEPALRGNGLGLGLVRYISDEINNLTKQSNISEIKMDACLVSEGGGSLSWTLFNTLKEVNSLSNCTFWAAPYGFIESPEELQQAVECEKY